MEVSSYRSASELLGSCSRASNIAWAVAEIRASSDVLTLGQGKLLYTISLLYLYLISSRPVTVRIQAICTLEVSTPKWYSVAEGMMSAALLAITSLGRKPIGM